MKVTLMEKIIYMDNAATTSVSKAAFNAMVPFYETHFGNPSSIYSIGQTAKNAIEDARKTVALCLGAKINEIFFTSCGSESDNWAIKGVAHAMLKKAKTI